MMPLATLVVVLLCCAQALGNAEHDLARSLLDNYPQPHFVRPVDDPHDAVPFNIDYRLISLADFKEEAAQMTVSGYLVMTWIDEFLTWDADETGVSKLRFNTGDLWTPDVRSYQGMIDEVSEHMGVVFSNGKVLRVPPVKHKIQCEAGEEHGHYICKFNLGSWAYPSSQVTTTYMGNSSHLNIDSYRPHPEWTIDDELSSVGVVDRVFSCCPDDVYQSLEVTIHIERSEHGHGGHHGHGHHSHGHGHQGEDSHGHGEDSHGQGEDSHGHGKGRPGKGRPGRGRRIYNEESPEDEDD